MAAGEAKLGHLSEAQRALGGLRVDTARLGELGHVLLGRSHEVEPEELAALAATSVRLGSRRSATARPAKIVGVQDATVGSINPCPGGGT